MAFTQSANYSTTKTVLARIAGLLLIIPLAPFICRYIPPIIIADWNADLLIAVIISILFVSLIAWLIKPLVIPALIVFSIFLVINIYTKAYSFTNVINDYKTMVSQNWTVREQKSFDDLSISPQIFESPESRVSRQVKQKVQYQDSVVRNFSIKHSLENFRPYENKYGMLTRYLSLFKYINQHFDYVPDPQKDEYYATPRETILNGLGGDCDDHSILMASCLMSIGAKCRIIIVEGHMYPELYAGNKKQFEILEQVIIQLFHEYRIERIYFHENKGEYWINLDYSATYPGGPYLNDDVKLLIDL